MILVNETDALREFYLFNLTFNQALIKALIPKSN